MTGKVLVYTTGKGSTGGSYKIYDMVVRGTAPVALVQIKAEPKSFDLLDLHGPVLVQGKIRQPAVSMNGPWSVQK